MEDGLVTLKFSDEVQWNKKGICFKSVVMRIEALGSAGKGLIFSRN
jgi:hypothetical protein